MWDEEIEYPEADNVHKSKASTKNVNDQGLEDSGSELSSINEDELSDRLSQLDSDVPNQQEFPEHECRNLNDTAGRNEDKEQQSTNQSEGISAGADEQELQWLRLDGGLIEFLKENSHLAIDKVPGGMKVST